MLKQLKIAVALLAVAFAAAGPAYALKAQYKLSVVVGPNTAWGMGAQRFADLVARKTDGRIKIKVYFSGALFAGKQTNEFVLLRQGVADFALGSTINWSPQVRQLNLFSLPFFFSGYAPLDAVESGRAGQELFKRLRALGVEPLGWGENGFRQLTNSVRPVAKPADLAGLKIRVVGSKIFIDTFQALGANPTAMPFSEALTALQQGVVDGQENPVPGVIVPYKLWEYKQKYLTVWNYVVDPLILGVNGQDWRSFSEQDRTALRAAAAEALAYQKALARVGLDQGKALAYLKQHDEVPDVTDPYGVLKEHGVHILELTPAQLQPFHDKVQPVVADWTKTIGPDLVHTAEADKATAQ